MEAYEAELEAWTKKTKKARKMIISTISPSVMIYVEGTKDPEMWAILEGRYKPKTRVTLRQLQRQFNTMKMIDDDGDMQSWQSVGPGRISPLDRSDRSYLGLRNIPDRSRDS